MLATTRIHKLVNHDGSAEKYSKNNFTLSIAVGSSDITAQASTNIGAENNQHDSSFQSDCLASSNLPWYASSPLAI